MKQVNLYYLTPNNMGGWVTYSAHLFRSLETVGVQPHLIKITQDHENRMTWPESDEGEAKRNFGYGLLHKNLTIEDAVKEDGIPKMILAGGKRYKEETKSLLDAGAFLMIHDPTELKNLPDHLPYNKVIIGRRSMNQHRSNAIFIRHPFGRQHVGPFPEKTQHAVSTTRLDFDKHTDIIFDANEQLPEELRVLIRGTENRIFERWELMPKYKWYKPLKGKWRFPREMDAALKILLPARFSVDMSANKGDGGGTQSCFLEAWDAGAIPIINRAWVEDYPGDDMVPGVNCIAVKDATELARTLKRGLPEDIRLIFQEAGAAQLEMHSWKHIGAQYAEVLCG